jgi:hypothetical protein
MPMLQSTSVNLVPFVSLRGIIPIKTHLEPHANTIFLVDSFHILIHSYNELAHPKKTKFPRHDSSTQMTVSSYVY